MRNLAGICPRRSVPLMRTVAAGDQDAAARLAKALILPETLGWVCNAPCERGAIGEFRRARLLECTGAWHETRIRAA